MAKSEHFGYELVIGGVWFKCYKRSRWHKKLNPAAVNNMISRGINNSLFMNVAINAEAHVQVWTMPGMLRILASHKLERTSVLDGALTLS
jgi:hypothetical protein